MNKVVIFCAPGFLKKTGYYFRCLRDKLNFEAVGYSAELLVFKPFTLKRAKKENYKIINIIDLIYLRKDIDIYFSENISMIFPIVILKTILRVKAKFGFVYHGSLHELKYDRFGTFKYSLYKFFEIYADKNMNFVFFISKSFKKMLNNQGLFRNVSSFITPNLPEKKFIDNINLLIAGDSIENENIVLTYVGNTQKWQNIDYLIYLFKNLNLMNEKFYLQLITSDMSEMVKKVQNFDLKSGSFKVFKVQNQDVPHYLVNSDCLLIVRDVNDTNRASCPTKAIEYLLSGTKLLVSDELGDISNLVDNYDLGYVLKDDDKENFELIYSKIMSFKNKKNKINLAEVCELSSKFNLEVYKKV